MSVKLPPPFAGPEHRPFLFSGSATAVLLVHGFPGTPSEMRPLAMAAQDLGCTVQGLLLPGFGPELPALESFTHEDWTHAVVSSAEALRSEHTSVLIAGNSIGASLAILAASRTQVDGLLLVTPFWRSHARWLDLAFPILRPFLTHMVPFRKTDFADPKVRANMQAVLGDIDLDNPDVQAEIRRLPLPVRALAQVRQAGRAAYRQAPTVHSPAWVIVASCDPVARPHLARRLARRLPALRAFVEVEGGHDLVREDWSTNPVLRSTLAQFALLQPEPIDSHGHGSFSTLSVSG